MSGTTVFFARSLSDVFSCLNSTPAPQVMAGCTQERGLPPSALFVALSPIEELTLIDHRERYIEFGSAATITQILGIAKRRLPPAFFEALESIGTPFVRNRATIGGNICAGGRRRTLFPALLALDARLEFRSHNETRYIPIGKFAKVPEGMILTKIRLPVDEWDVSVFRRLGPSRLFSGESAAFVFLAMTGKGVLTDLRIAYSRDGVYRSRALENRLIGLRLPLPQKTIFTLLDETRGRLKESAGESAFYEALGSSVAVRQYLDLLEFALAQLG
jgi:CO/xanthine dehydrogenase FAD-binding subunit